MPLPPFRRAPAIPALDSSILTDRTLAVTRRVFAAVTALTQAASVTPRPVVEGEPALVDIQVPAEVWALVTGAAGEMNRVANAARAAAGLPPK